MKRLGLLAIFLAVVLCGAAARADFYVVGAGGPPVGTRIISVPYTITQPGFYYFGKNLTYNGSGNAITIDADNVTLDLMGFSLTQGGVTGSGDGIRMNNRANVEIRNGTVNGFFYGAIEGISAGKNHRVINIRATNNTFGIYFASNNNLINNCTASNNSSIGIFLWSGSITHSVASNNSYGIYLLGPGNVLENSVFNNSTRNFSLGSGVATAILADRNSAFGLATNYYVEPGTTGIQWGINAGSP